MCLCVAHASAKERKRIQD